MTMLPPEQTGDDAATSADALDGQLGAILDYVRQCEMRVARGELMELSGLDRTVMQLCEDVMKLPTVQARALQPRMLQLIEGLDILAARIKEQKGAADGAQIGGRAP